MKRNEALDFLRFIGVLLTLFAHLQLPSNNNELYFTLSKIKIFGPLGVKLFFVLSGYLVSGLVFIEIEKYGSFDVKRFLIRRGLKIYPSYYFAILLGILISFFAHNKYQLDQIISEALFICNYFKIKNYWLWSISVEEHFYFILSLLLFVLHKRKKLNFKQIVFVYLFFLLIAGVSTIYNIANNNLKFDTFIKSHMNFHSLFLGVLLFYMNRYKRDKLTFFYNHKNWLLIISLFLIILPQLKFIPITPIFVYLINFFVSVFLGVILMFSIEKNSLRNNIVVKFLASIGLYSYPIYLYHGYINQLSKRIITNNDHLYWIYFFSYIFGSLLFGMLLSKLIEYPFINIRDKFFPTRSK